MNCLSGLTQAEISSKDLIELLKSRDEQLKRAPLKIEGTKTIRLSDGYGERNGLMRGQYPYDQRIPVPFYYAQDGKSIFYSKSVRYDVQDKEWKSKPSEVETWRDEKSLLKRVTNGDVVEYVVPRFDDADHWPTLIDYCMSETPLDPFSIRERSNVDVIIGVLSNSNIKHSITREGRFLTLKWSEPYGVYTKAWDGYYHRHQYVFDLERGGLLLSHLDEYITKDPSLEPDWKRSTRTYHSDHVSVAGVWIPRKVRHEIQLWSAELISQKEQPGRIAPIHSLTYEIDIKKVSKLEDSRSIKSSIEPGVPISDRLKSVDET